MPEILYMGWFKDLNDEYNWLFFTSPYDYAEAKKRFFEVFKSDFDGEELPQDNFIDVYPITEVGDYKINLVERGK